MSEFAWFKLLVRLVGLLLLGFSVPMLLHVIGRLLASGIPNSGMQTSMSLRIELSSNLPALIGDGAQAAFGAYLFFRGDWVIRRVLAEIHGRCAVCGFDLSAVKASSCPECNTPFRHSKSEVESKKPE